VHYVELCVLSPCRIPSSLPKRVLFCRTGFPFFHFWILRVRLVLDQPGLVLRGWSSGRSVGMTFVPFPVFTLWRAFLHDFDIMLISFQICVFGFESKCIHGTTVKYTKGNRIEKGFDITNARGRGTQTECGCLRMAQGSLLIHAKDGLSSRLKSVSSSHWDSHFLFPLPPRAWSSTMARMVSGCRSRSHVPVL